MSRRNIDVLLKLNRIDDKNGDIRCASISSHTLCSPVSLLMPPRCTIIPTCTEMRVRANLSNLLPRFLLRSQRQPLAKVTLRRGRRCDRHQRRRRQRDRYVVIFTLRSHARTLHCVSAHRYTVVNHLHVSIIEMNKLAGGTVAHLSIKILAHREGVQ